MLTVCKHTAASSLRDKDTVQTILHKACLWIKSVRAEWRTCMVKHTISDKVTSLWSLKVELKGTKERTKKRTKTLLQIQKREHTWCWTTAPRHPCLDSHFIGFSPSKTQSQLEKREQRFQSTGTEQTTSPKRHISHLSFTSSHPLRYLNPTWIASLWGKG